MKIIINIGLNVGNIEPIGQLREVESGSKGSFDNCVKHWSNRTPHMLP